MKAEMHSHECAGNAITGGAAGSKNRRATQPPAFLGTRALLES